MGDDLARHPRASCFADCDFGSSVRLDELGGRFPQATFDLDHRHDHHGLKPIGRHHGAHLPQLPTLQRIAAVLDEELLVCFQRTVDGEVQREFAAVA
jgi:hypothetical protein